MSLSSVKNLSLFNDEPFNLVKKTQRNQQKKVNKTDDAVCCQKHTIITGFHIMRQVKTSQNTLQIIVLKQPLL